MDIEGKLEAYRGNSGSEVGIMAIWIPELVDYYNTTLTTIKVDNKPITVSFAKPDITSRPDDIQNALPEINFKDYDIIPDKSRYQSAILLTRNMDTVNRTIETAPYPIPYEIYFQFILVAKNMDDIVQMESQFMTLFPPRAVISVLDPSINDTYSLDMLQRSYRVLDPEEINTPRYGQVPIRIFRRMYRCCVRCEHDIFTWSTTPIATTITPTTNLM